MKHRISISLEEETLFQLKEKLRNSSYKSQSHLVEEAIKKLVDKNAQ